MTKEPLVHTGIQDGLDEIHPLAHKSIYCDSCGKMVHAFNNECMQDWLEFEDANLCWKCGSKRLEEL